MISDSLLQGVYLFTDLDADERASLARIAEEMNLSAGFPIFRAGDPATALYLIKDGSVRVAVISSNGQSIDVATLGSGSHFGEMALIDHAPRAATVTAQTDCTLAAIDEKRFLFLTQQTPTFALNVMRVLSQRLRRMDAMVNG